MSEWISNGLFLSFICLIPLYGYKKGVRVYDTFIEGAKDGIQVILHIVPYLVAMLVAIGMLRASGAFSTMANWLGPVLKFIGIPSEILPLALVRPFSGTAATGVMVELIDTHGGDSFLANAAATVMGSTETTFYVLAIYFGSIGIQRTRHAVPVGLIADMVGLVVGVWVCRFVFL